ncbi:MAG: hypothetical protein JWM37_666 [Candidatus Saccharibacteria bacterium]|nr:hypothetical protein [Candidatus Saccharibacteria bacterium]
MLTDIVLLLTGVIVGGMNAIAGGGMLIGFPVMVALGVPPLIANASGNVVTMPGQLSSAFAYRRLLRRVPKYYLLLLVPTFIGSIYGAYLLRHTDPTHFADLVPLLVLCAVLLFAFQPFIHFHLHRQVYSRVTRAIPFILISIALLPLSIYGGYFGAGYGFIMLAFLGLTNLRDAHMMNAIKNVGAVVISSCSILVLFSANLIDWHHAICMGIGSLIGGYLGAVGAQRVSTHAIRIAVIVIGLAAVVFLVLCDY